MRKLLYVKFLLCANPYLIVFFPMLQNHGLTSGNILTAISIGTLTMILGDGLSSYLVDRFGPKRPVILASLIQAISIFYLSICSTYTELIIFEILMGLSFPAIYGADSKWLKVLAPKNQNREKLNQNVFWFSQLISACVGCMFLFNPGVICVLNGFLYMVGAVLCVKLKDVPSAKINSNRDREEKDRQLSRIYWQPILIYGFLMGGVAISSWFLQYETSKYAESSPYLFAVFQIFGAFLSLSGSLVKPDSKTIWVVMAIMSIFLYPLFGLIESGVGLWFAIITGLLARGAIGVLSRNRILNQLESNAPIATLNFFLGGWAKIVQASLLAALSWIK